VTAASAAEIDPAPITKAAVFRERCEARAILWRASEFSLHEAVDVLQADAERLVAEIGQDAVQEIMAAAFAAVRIGADLIPAIDDMSRPTRRSRTPQPTIEAVLFCVRERGIDALKEPNNVERLSRCDDAAKRQIKDRIQKLGLVR
jgi:uncharacterized sporulation protein YeaH/YhbH (DUF444 family)